MWQVKNYREAIKMSGNTPYGNNETSIMVFSVVCLLYPSKVVATETMSTNRKF
jgi:hypothetical protein